jgi:hypothetical protein
MLISRIKATALVVTGVSFCLIPFVGWPAFEVMVGSVILTCICNGVE